MKMRKGYERRGAWLHQGMRLAKVKEIHDTQTDTARDRGTPSPFASRSRQHCLGKEIKEWVQWKKKMQRGERNETHNGKGGKRREVSGGEREKEGTEGGGITTHTLFWHICNTHTHTHTTHMCTPTHAQPQSFLIYAHTLSFSLTHRRHYIKQLTLHAIANCYTKEKKRGSEEEKGMRF